MCRETLASTGLIAGTVLIGKFAWSGQVLLLPLALLFPLLWSLAPSRLIVAMIATGYFLAASRGLPQGVVNFYGSDEAYGYALWPAAAAGFVFVHTVGKGFRESRRRSERSRPRQAGDHHPTDCL
jgi:hypothetical protein